MTTRVLTNQLDGVVLDAAYNWTNVLLAVQYGNRVGVQWREDPNARFQDLASLPLPPQHRDVCCLAWSRPAEGNVLAAGTRTGALLLWEGPDDTAAPNGDWHQLAAPACGRSRIRQLAFQPRMQPSMLAAIADIVHQDGHASGEVAGAAMGQRMTSTLAAVCDDGFVRFFERRRAPRAMPNADSEIDAEAPASLSWTAWELTDTLLVPPAQGPPRCLSWRSPDDDAVTGIELPPMFALGTADGVASVWRRCKAARAWVQACTLPLGTDDEGENKEVSCVAWAPPLGRSQETVAVAVGTTVTLCTLRGPVDDLQAEAGAVLAQRAPVWQLEWNLLGSWLAASTEAGQVALWRPDFSGEWLLCNTIAGGEGLPAADDMS